jgi:hypothetical protein
LVIDEKYHLQNEIAQKEAHIQTLQDEKDNKIKDLEQKLEMISHHLQNLGLKQ